MKDFKEKIKANKAAENIRREKKNVEINQGTCIIKVDKGRVRVSDPLLIDYTTEALRGYTPEKNSVIRLSACCDAMFDLLVTEITEEKISMCII